MQSTETHVHHGTMTKVERYKWTMKDGQGQFMLLHKSRIGIDHAYQREAVETKIQAIASSWSWVAFGAVVVALRDDGSFVVIDGQHRVSAARRRADVEMLPCMVFETENTASEASGFLNANTLRRPLSGLDKHKAKVLVGSPDAVAAERIATSHGYKIKKGGSEHWSVKAVTLIERLAYEDADALDATFLVLSRCLGGAFAHEKILSSLHFLHAKKHVNLLDSRVQQAIKSVGAVGMLEAINRAAAYYARGGVATWADGLSKALNKGRRIPVSTYQAAA
ncbi:DUF6551 family protein [Thiohalocapsa marina]|uniref:DUF6551 family protein n=1 Tax=Thiohalocapsa marina TaxID=424902 RepID=UPI0036DA8A3F